ncbi:sodium-coupled monocarboxylate transporter 1 isoform X2 [Nematostella vectensis]|uniref:sodium-coupled monocarboxylate transporter 1 isoform X2 n=1 Tax=Nematostella vectensis TaxID=45351 RepID=UPI0020777BF1|nr:sodium-coupled monocarboxylate transporter 1 isoform X2 [Nematostella vectensis]
MMSPDGGVVVRFGAVDYSVFAIMLLISTGIGIYHALTGGKQKTTAEFLLANRKMMFLPVALSLLASFMSAITILGVPSEMYTFGTQYWMIISSYVILFPAVALVFVPVFRAVHITSSYEYLEKRFSLVIRSIGSALFIIQTCLYMAIVTYGPSLALEAVTGFPIWVSIVALGVVCTFYTTIGGMKAVIWNDVLQAIIMLVGLVAVVVVGSQKVGGFTEVWKTMEKGARLKFIDFNPDPTQRLSIWSLMIGGAFGLFPLWAVNQTAVQRFLSAKSDKEAKRSVWINLPLSILAVSLCAMCGCVIYAFYHNCDPKSLKVISSGDQILPYFVMHVLGELYGIPGLFLACLFSGTLSTVSSGLNSLAAVVLEDIIRPFNKIYNRTMTESTATKYTKILALFFGVLTVGLSFLAMKMGAILTTFYRVFGVVGGPVVGIFCLGMLTRKANTRGALVGLMLGFAFGLWIGIGAQVYPPPLSLPPVSTSGCESGLNTTAPVTNVTTPPPQPPHSYEGLTLYRLSFLWYSGACFGVTFVFGLLVSYLFPGDHKCDDVDPRLLFNYRKCFSSSEDEIELYQGREEVQQENEGTGLEAHRETVSSAALLNVSSL